MDRAERSPDGEDEVGEVVQQPVDRPARPGQAQQLLDALLAAVAAATQTEIHTTGADRHTLVLHTRAADLLAGEADQAVAAPVGAASDGGAADGARQPDAAVEAVDGPGEAVAAGVVERRVPVTGATRRLTPMSVRVLRQLACDAGIVLVATDHTGSPIDVGRRHRRLTVALRRALRLRDATCRSPGCATRRHLPAHHLVHWADGGPTDLDNLVLLCGHHHRVVHQAGWAVDRDPGGQLRFAPPGRTPLPPSLPLAGASAAAVSDRIALLPEEAVSGLEPDGWDGTMPVDVDLAVAVLHQELSRVRPDLAMAA